MSLKVGVQYNDKKGKGSLEVEFSGAGALKKNLFQ